VENILRREEAKERFQLRALCGLAS